MESTQKMISDGKLIPDGYDYRTDDGRIIKRVYIGRGYTTRWMVEGKTFVHRSLFEAYYEIEF